MRRITDLPRERERAHQWIRAALTTLAGAAAVLAVGQQPSQDKKPNALGPVSFRAHKVSSPPVIDGSIVPEEWLNAATASKFMDQQHQPEQGKTTFYLQYDEKYVYFAAVVTESHRPKATATGTNVPFGIDDMIVLQFDTFGEGKNDGLNFCSINGRGATNFRKAGGSSQKREWRGSFEGSAKIADDGWTVEARVPWSIFRMPKSGTRNLRFNFVRTDSVTENPYWYYLPKETENVSGVIWEGVEV
ncbi:MAG: sugar-binding protein, partial [Fimbriimonadaceae bacterium]